MVTLQKYLYDPWDSPIARQESRLQCWVDLALHLLSSVKEHVLGSAGDLDLRESLESIQQIIALERSPAEILDVALQFSAILKSYHDRMAQNVRAQNHDLYRILTTLNEALLLLAAGSTRTVGRLKQLESSLEQAATISDFSALKSRLAQILTLIREEVNNERSERDREQEDLHAEIDQIRQGTRLLRSELPGHQEAVAALERLLQHSGLPDSPPEFCVVVLVLSRMREVVRRYGDVAANDLIAELVHRRIDLADGEPNAYRWSPESVVISLRWTRGVNQLSAALEGQIVSPFEHRICLGPRTAVLRMGIHWVVFPVTGPSAFLCDQIETFTGGHA